MSYKEHKAFSVNKVEGRKLWRYMNLDKFLYLIKNSKLYFCSLDSLTNYDKNEGLFPEIRGSNLLRLYDELPKNMQSRVIDKKAYDESIKEISKIWKSETFRGQFAVNCWHMNNTENYLMWKSYTDSVNSVCIQTTVDSIIAAISSSNEDIFIGCVDYIDETSDIMQPTMRKETDLFKVSMIKRKYFEGEDELRLVYHKWPELNKIDLKEMFSDLGCEVKEDRSGNVIIKSNDYLNDSEKLLDYNNKTMLSGSINGGVSINVDVSKLIESVYVPNNCDEFFPDIVRSELKMSGISAEVIKSGI